MPSAGAISLKVSCTADLLKAVDHHVNFKYVRLPKKHRIPRLQAMIMGEMKVYRNIGLVGDSIWFICITPSDGGASHTMVEVWTLDLTQPLVGIRP
jgi:hypothetical protein